MTELHTLIKSNSVDALHFKISFLVQALDQVYKLQTQFETIDLIRFGRQVSAATRQYAWSSAMHLPIKEMHEFASKRAERYVNPRMLPLWIIDLIRLRLMLG